MGERLYEVGRVVDAVSRAYHGDTAAIVRFLNRPHQLLGGRTPLAMAQSSSAGADAVINLVRRADAGFAVESVVEKATINVVIPALKEAGATDLLELPIAKIVA